MRPLLYDDAFTGRSRSTNEVTRAMPPPITCFIADEKTMDSSSPSHSTLFPRSRNIAKKADYGVESYETLTSSLIPDTHDLDERPSNIRQTRGNLAENSTNSRQNLQTAEMFPASCPSPDLSRNTSPYRRQNATSRPFTPLSSHSPILASSLSSPDSRIISDTGYFTDENPSQDIQSNRLEEHETGLQDSGSTTQFVMPSIKMPSRRPFTEKGRNMGRLKILIAGDSGIGKTSLVKAIVQICQDIVHVDPIHVASPKLYCRNFNCTRRVRSRTPDIESTSKITEIYASTKPYPVWWSDLEDSHLLKRRRNAEDSVLERNLCFVDTPGYNTNTSQMECVFSVLDYIESQFKKISTIEGPNESEMINMLCGNGGNQVDLSGVKTIDIEYMSRLSQLTNIIPLMAHSDRHSEQQISSIKKHIMNELRSVKIKPFLFELNSNLDSDPKSSQTLIPFAISCKTSPDYETMDASLLMSPDYVQPLVESELTVLIHKIFQRDSISWLRHVAAKKYILWRKSSGTSATPQTLYHPLRTLSSSQILTAPVGPTTSYALAKITDHTQREERIAQVRLANWAADLQRSLQIERSRFESIARSERAVWLTERFGECVQDGTIVPLSQVRKDKNKIDSELNSIIKPSSFSPHDLKDRYVDASDPLGLLSLNYEFKRRGWILLKMLSSLGIISGFAFYVARAWHENWQIFGLGLRDWIGLRVFYC
ncbi:putative heat shock protein [Golovinomyces cichoracearum]|uniref:Putative heat shock protein n=1 Tax=Golovinomyces cichoracearum TaxID=62708 RepID=A0A420I922_9PEZI|nr:putative heat shock protein [Golovinomyces cichoracearum]